MAVKGVIRAGKPYEIFFSSDAMNGELSQLSHGWISLAQPAPPPLVAIDFVAPGASMPQRGTAPASATYDSLRIDVDLPDRGKGRLTVRQDGAVLADEALLGDVRWVFVLTP